MSLWDMGVHTRPAFLHLQLAVMQPILQLKITVRVVFGGRGADDFSEPTGRSTSARISQPHCVQSSSFPRHFWIRRYALKLCCLTEPVVGDRVARFVTLSKDCFLVICLSLKKVRGTSQHHIPGKEETFTCSSYYLFWYIFVVKYCYICQMKDAT